jgi:hypothetical protein
MGWEHLEKHTGITEKPLWVNSESGMKTNFTFSLDRLGPWQVGECSKKACVSFQHLMKSSCFLLSNKIDVD